MDDDKHSINALKGYINTLPILQLLKAYDDPLIAMGELLYGQQVDLMFMDIDMPKISGLELSKALREKSRKLIFTTGYSQYGYEAFTLHADAYLLKPYSFAMFAETVNRIIGTAGQQPFLTGESGAEFFFVRNKVDQNNLIKVDYRDIVLIESLQNYVRIVREHDQIIAYLSLSEISERLVEHPTFMQVHRSFLISTAYLKKVEGNMLYLSNGQEISIGKSYREAVHHYIRARTFKTGRA